jgi:FeS assembly SUF system regulator
MLKLSKLTDYAVVVLVRLSEESGIQTSGGIAANTGVPEPTVAKVLKIMTTAGLVLSQRGARGGYRLAKPLATISIVEVIMAIDGPIALTACVEHSATVCDASSLCPVKGRWDTVNTAIRDALSAISLADMRPTCFFPLPAHHVQRRGVSASTTAPASTTALVE